MGRAARNINGRVILYADVITDSMRRAIDETQRRRAIQRAYNESNNIIPQTIIKPIDASLVAVAEGDYVTVPLDDEDFASSVPPEQLEKYLAELEEKMRAAASKFDFKQAAQYRDRLKDLRNRVALEGSGSDRTGADGTGIEPSESGNIHTVTS
jgi:excinuclease ABC subunit B